MGIFSMHLFLKKRVATCVILTLVDHKYYANCSLDLTVSGINLCDVDIDSSHFLW